MTRSGMLKVALAVMLGAGSSLGASAAVAATGQVAGSGGAAPVAQATSDEGRSYEDRENAARGLTDFEAGDDVVYIGGGAGLLLLLILLIIIF